MVQSTSLNIWHETGATIIAIQQKDELLLSPGPYAKICAGDTLFFVGRRTGIATNAALVLPRKWI